MVLSSTCSPVVVVEVDTVVKEVAVAVVVDVLVQGTAGNLDVQNDCTAGSLDSGRRAK